MEEFCNGIKCFICLKYFNKENKVITLNCGHSFCSFCLDIHQNQACFICKKDIIDFNLNNNYLIDIFSFINVDNLKFTKEVKNINYCVKCGEIVINEKLHLNLYPDHNLLNLAMLKEKINKLRSEFVNKTKNKKISEYLLTIRKKIDLNQLKNNLLKHQIAGIIPHMQDNIQTLKKCNIIKFKANFAGLKEKIVSSKLKNKVILDELVKFQFQSYKFISNYRNLQRKTLISYIKNTKKVVLYDLENKLSEIFEIDLLPFNFYRLSQSIEYNHISKTIVIIGGKQDNLLYSQPSKNVWQYEIYSKHLKKIFELPKGMQNQRSVFVNNILYIIGGDNTNEYSSNILKINFVSYSKLEIKELCNLNVARSLFGVSLVNDNTIYIFFGQSTNNKILNSIEVLNLNSTSKFCKLIELNELFYNCLKMKNVGVIYDSDKEYFIIIGGQNSDNIQNKKIYTFDKNNYSLIEKNEDRLIADSHFLSFGIQYNDTYGILSSDRMNEQDPTLFLYCSNKWNCYEISLD